MTHNNTSLRDRLQNWYLDWWNNFLTPTRFAEYYGWNETTAKRVIAVGRRVHNRRVAKLKPTRTTH
jgi:hypothetical protein